MKWLADVGEITNARELGGQFDVKWTVIFEKSFHLKRWG